MNMRRMMTVLALCLIGSGSVLAGDVPVPSDISVTLTAEPSVNLQSGQRINFTISVTNHGPEPVDRLAFASSLIYDELDVFSGSSSGCDGDMVLQVLDFETYFYYRFAYYVADPNTPMAVGETRTCQLSLDYTQWAPPVFPVTFDMSIFDDLYPSNNSATVVLRRAVVAAQPVPSSSLTASGLLVFALVATVRTRRMRVTNGRRSRFH
jgi:hypothetical protein